MKLIITCYVCADCYNKFDSPAILPGAYGDFLLRSPEGEMAFLNGLDDEIYTEVSELLESLPSLAGKDSGEIADVLMKIFGTAACDPSPHGLPYSMLAKPPCPICRSQRMASWEHKVPFEVVDIEVPPITHHFWKKLNKREKIEMIQKELDAAFPGDIK